MTYLPPQPPAPLRTWLAGAIDANAAATIARVRAAAGVVHVAVLPDVHLARDVCVGTAMATVDWLYPAAVGGDIGCGVLAVPFDADGPDLLRDPARAGTILRRLGQLIPTSRRHRRHVRPLPPNLEDTPLSHGSLAAVLADVGRLHLGTLGGGNHFAELAADVADGQLWLTVHTGSRAMGQAVRDHHVAAATHRSAGMMAVPADSPAGRAYLHDQQWARAYAAANRAAIASAIVDLLTTEFGVRPAAGTIACHHNHVAAEVHGDRPVWVHRKGAMPAAAGLAGVVPGSMGTRTAHVVGRGCPSSLNSSAHGAGRAYSRAAARERFSRADVRQQLQGVWFDPRLTDALREELPKAYKDVRAVLAAQTELIDVTRTLRPLLAYKGQ